MRNALPLFLIVTLALGACQSRWNPGNWFGSDTEVPQGSTNPLIPDDEAGIFSSSVDPVYLGTPIATVKSVKVERVTEGALITAIGVPTVHGVYSVTLAPRNNGKPENGVLILDLLGIHPQGAPWGGSERAREVTVATVATTQQLQGVRTIRVVAAQNARQSRR